MSHACVFPFRTSCRISAELIKKWWPQPLSLIRSEGRSIQLSEKYYLAVIHSRLVSVGDIRSDEERLTYGCFLFLLCARKWIASEGDSSLCVFNNKGGENIFFFSLEVGVHMNWQMPFGQKYWKNGSEELQVLDCISVPFLLCSPNSYEGSVAMTIYISPYIPIGSLLIKRKKSLYRIKLPFLP